eukprot:387361-Rhodomonas_salina.1
MVLILAFTAVTDVITLVVPYNTDHKNNNGIDTVFWITLLHLITICFMILVLAANMKTIAETMTTTTTTTVLSDDDEAEYDDSLTIDELESGRYTRFPHLNKKK